MQQYLQSRISSNQKKPINPFPVAKIILFSKFKPFLKIVPRKVSVMQTEFETETILFAINKRGNTFQFVLSYQWGFPGGLVVKSPPANAGDTGSIPELIPWRRKWQPTPVFLPGKFHRQESLVGYSPQGCKESDTT